VALCRSDRGRPAHITGTGYAPGHAAYDDDDEDDDNELFLSASGQKLPSWCTKRSTAVHHRTLARSLTLPTFQVAGDFALPAATASSSLRFTAPLLAAEHSRLLALSVELSAVGDYIGTISGDLPHLT